MPSTNVIFPVPFGSLLRKEQTFHNPSFKGLGNGLSVCDFLFCGTAITSASCHSFIFSFHIPVFLSYSRLDFYTGQRDCLTIEQAHQFMVLYVFFFFGHANKCVTNDDVIGSSVKPLF
jgi:hypothetical protein